MTPQAHLVSINRQLRYAARHRNATKLDTYLASPAFLQSMAALPAPTRLQVVLTAIPNAVAACEQSRGPPLKPSNRFNTARTPIKWTEMNKARFKKGYAKGGLEGGARAVGITIGAAKLAAKRLGLRVATATTEHEQKAA